MKQSLNKTFLFVGKLGIKKVESTEVDVNNIIYNFKLNKKKNSVILVSSNGHFFWI